MNDKDTTAKLNKKLRELNQRIQTKQYKKNGKDVKM